VDRLSIVLPFFGTVKGTIFMLQSYDTIPPFCKKKAEKKELPAECLVIQPASFP